MRSSMKYRLLTRLLPLLLLAFSSEACVGKFLSTLLSTENAQFKLIEVVPVANTKILVSFSKPLDFDKGALVAGNYSIPGLNIISVSKATDTNQVYLLLDPNDSVRMQRQYYTLSVSGVKNLYLDDLLPGAENRSKQFMGARWLRATCLDDTGAFTCPSSGTSLAAPITVTVRGDYARGTNYRWALYNVTAASYVTSGLAHSPATQSAVTPIASTFVIPNTIPTADFRLEMMIQDDAGAWQPASDQTLYYFSVDNTSVSNVGLSNPPASPTGIAVTNISVAYRNCVEPAFPNGYSAPCYSAASPVAAEIPTYYKYRIGSKAGSQTSDCNGAGYTFNAWSSSRSTNLPINETLSTAQCYLIQVVAADNVGNYQCDTTAGTCTGYADLNAFFTAKPHQEARFLFDNVAPTAVLDTNTLPVNPTSATSFAVTVLSTAADATPVSKYQYRVLGSGFSGAWSTDKNPGSSGDTISGAGLTNGTYTIEVIGKDAAGNYQSTSAATTHTFVVDTTAPTAGVSSNAACGSSTTGLPVNPTRFNCYNIAVTGVTYYKAKIVSGSTCGTGGYSAQKTAATDFITEALFPPPGGWIDGTTYSVCVIGSNNGTLYQGEAETAVTRHTFKYDITPPTSQVGTWISPASSLAGKSTVKTDVSVNIAKLGIEEITAYKGVVVQGACPSAATMVASDVTYPPYSPQTALQATGLTASPPQTTRICFIARDAAGNYEATVNQITYTVFAPPTPDDGVAGLDDAYTNSFNLTWTTGATGIPTDTKEIWIRVCKDSACSSPLPGMSNGKQVCANAAACAAVSLYTLNTSCSALDCIKQINGETYYAQLRVKDSIDNESLFGTSSTGKRIVAAITGVIRDTNNNPVSGATVGLYQTNCTTQIGANVTTPGTGVFTFQLPGHTIPIKLSSSGYCIKAVSGVMQGTKTYVEAKAGVTTDAGNLYVVDTTGKGCIVGAVVDGSSGSQLLLSNATFTLKDYAQNTVATTPSLDPDGKQFAFPSGCVTSWGTAPYNSPTFDQSGQGITSGVYSLQIAIPGYYTINESAIGVVNNTTTNMGFLPMVGTFASGSKQIKVILTWGNQTKDLDLHIVGPASNAYDCQSYNEAAIQNANGATSKFHVSYQQRYCAETGTSAPYGSTQLAVDDTYEYGPEILNFFTGFVDGTYKVSVFNNDATALNWNVSKARIDVYAGDFFTGGGGLIKTVLSTGASTNRGWKALRLVISGTSLTVDDTTSVGYANWSYGTGTFTCDGFRINGPSDGLTAGALPSAGQSPKDPNLDCGLYLNGTTAAGGAGPLDW